MGTRFTDAASKVMALAGEEAQRFHHKYIDTEHILLGLFKEGSGVAAEVLKKLNIDTGKLLREVEKLLRSKDNIIKISNFPQSPGVQKVIAYALEEAKALNKDRIGTEHILLGLLRETEGIAAQVLANLGLTLQDVRQEIKKIKQK